MWSDGLLIIYLWSRSNSRTLRNCRGILVKVPVYFWHRTKNWIELVTVDSHHIYSFTNCLIKLTERKKNHLCYTLLQKILVQIYWSFTSHKHVRKQTIKYSLFHTFHMKGSHRYFTMLCAEPIVTFSQTARYVNGLQYSAILFPAHWEVLWEFCPCINCDEVFSFRWSEFFLDGIVHWITDSIPSLSSTPEYKRCDENSTEELGMPSSSQYLCHCETFTVEQST